MEKILSYDHEQYEKPNFSEKLRNDLREYTPEIVVTPKDFDFICAVLDEMHDKYGDSASENYLVYHNDIHAYDVVHRVVVLSNTFRENAPDAFDDHSITLALIAAAGHDIIQKQATERATDEDLSAEYMRQVMIERGYSELDANRVAHAIIATTAEKSASGVHQTRVREGEPDPIKLIVAMADIQATTMEGTDRMLIDVARLYFEINPPSSCSVSEHINGLSAFMLGQINFIGDRLDSIPGDLRYYFSEHTAQAIEVSNRIAFRNKGLSVIHTARDVHKEASKLVESLSKNIKSIPEGPILASKAAQEALRKSISKLSNR